MNTAKGFLLLFGLKALFVEGAFDIDAQLLAFDGVNDSPSCPMFSCNNEECLPVTNIRSTWNHGMEAVITIPIKEEVDGWYMKISFSNPIGELQIWKARFVSTSPDKTAVILKNQPWNREIYDDHIAFHVLLKKQFSSWDIISITFQSANCPKFTFGKLPSPKPNTTSIVPTTTPKSCPTFRCNSTQCLPNTCLRNNWHSGMGVALLIPAMPCEVRGWEVKFEFDNTVGRLELWNARQISRGKSNFILRNIGNSRRLMAGEELKIPFNVAKNGRKRNIVGIDFKALDCSSFCKLKSTTPATPVECQTISCSGSDCSTFVTAHPAQGNILGGQFKIPIPCTIDGWEVEVEFSQTVRKIQISGAGPMTKMFRTKSIKMRNLCDRSKVLSGNAVVISFVLKTIPGKTDVVKIDLKPRKCKGCTITIAPTSMQTTHGSTATTRLPEVTTDITTTKSPATDSGTTKSTRTDNASTQEPVTDNATTNPPTTDNGTTQPSATDSATTQSPLTNNTTTQSKSTTEVITKVTTNGIGSTLVPDTSKQLSSKATDRPIPTVATKETVNP